EGPTGAEPQDGGGSEDAATHARALHRMATRPGYPVGSPGWPKGCRERALRPPVTPAEHGPAADNRAGRQLHQAAGQIGRRRRGEQGGNLEFEALLLGYLISAPAALRDLPQASLPSTSPTL